MFDTLEEGSMKHEETSETNLTTRSQDLVKEEVNTSKDQETSRKYKKEEQYN